MPDKLPGRPLAQTDIGMMTDVLGETSDNKERTRKTRLQKFQKHAWDIQMKATVAKNIVQTRATHASKKLQSKATVVREQLDHMVEYSGVAQISMFTERYL